MKKDNEILGGFSALFDSITPNDNIKIKGVEVVEDPNDPTSDTVFDLQDEDDDDFNPFTDRIEEDEDQSTEDLKEIESTEEPPAKKKEDKSTEAVAVEDIDENESTQVIAFFDAIAEQVGWTDISDEEKPKSVESFVEYLKSAVESSSVPSYANDDVAALDEYVKAGGKIEDYLSGAKLDVDYDSLDLSDVNTQKLVIEELMTNQGLSATQIRRKIEKYEDADLLQDEATDAIESLKEIKDENKKALLAEQKKEHDSTIKQQQTFYTNVVGEIEALTDVRGIKIPKEDKKTLMDYIFKVESDGKTKYQKEYSKSTKNLIESAYFTMKGDALISQAKRSGETSATERLKTTLKSNKVSGSKQIINNGSPAPLWSIASQQLLNRPQ